MHENIESLLPFPKRSAQGVERAWPGDDRDVATELLAPLFRQLRARSWFCAAYQTPENLRKLRKLAHRLHVESIKIRRSPLLMPRSMEVDWDFLRCARDFAKGAVSREHFFARLKSYTAHVNAEKQEARR